ncbi:amidohydrolase family protein [Secundilactobacillus hailunensis]|uniref:Amidohydrolase family protein n=1 Tax=Secundilactobacillus hailunensis TaxID=2559923 RepID=A0ABW1T6Y6_9LACO|nr:amidohydrolase family protein [Secundilactobacillus hailunensis]
MVKLIGVEEHFTSPAAQQAPQSKPAHTKIDPQVGQAIGGGLAQYSADEQLQESVESRISFLDQHGMQMQVLSDAGLENTPVNIAIPLAQQMNDQLAEIVAAHPTRFAGFAALPLQDVDASVKELHRAAKKGLHGTMIHGRVGGKWLDDPVFKPLWQAATELDMPVYIHPAITNPQVMSTYYLSDQYSLGTGGALGLPGFGWHAETGLEFVRLVLAGRFDEFPRLKIMMGHWGEVVSFFMHRMDETIMPTHPNIKHDVSDYFHQHLYVSPSGMFDQNQLNWAVSEFGADHVMFSTDYPYEPTDKIQTFLADSALSVADQEQIGSQTVTDLLHL